MDAEVHNSAASLVDGKPDNSPNGLVAIYVPSQHERSHLI
jgi:hypothetical protein